MAPKAAKKDELQQKSPAEFFADNKNIAGFDNVRGARGRVLRAARGVRTRCGRAGIASLWRPAPCRRRRGRLATGAPPRHRARARGRPRARSRCRPAAPRAALPAAPAAGQMPLHNGAGAGGERAGQRGEHQQAA
jgi:hypothetical protein